MKLFIHAFFSVIVKIYYSGTVKKIRERKLAKISARVEERRQQVNQKLLAGLHKNKEKHWEQHLSEMGIQTLAVYGAGAVGKELMKQLKRSGCQVQYFVDKFNMESEIEGALVLQFRRDYLPEVDAVIITPCHEFDFIVFQLQNYYGRSVKLLALDQLLWGGVAQDEAYICVCRIPQVCDYYSGRNSAWAPRPCAAML